MLLAENALLVGLFYVVYVMYRATLGAVALVLVRTLRERLETRERWKLVNSCNARGCVNAWE